MKDCKRRNKRYQDPDIDIEDDLSNWHWGLRVEDCLVPLGKKDNDLRPKSVKRVEVSLATSIGCWS